MHLIQTQGIFIFTCLYVRSATHIIKKKSPERKSLSNAVMMKNAQDEAQGGPMTMAGSSSSETKLILPTSSFCTSLKQKGSRASVAVTRLPKIRYPIPCSTTFTWKTEVLQHNFTPTALTCYFLVSYNYLEGKYQCKHPKQSVFKCLQRSLQ